MLQKLDILNFLAFEDLRVEFSPTINVIIGENSTGKSILLKTILFLYSLIPDIEKQRIVPLVPHESAVNLMKMVFDPRSEIDSFRYENRDRTINLDASFEDEKWIQVNIRKELKAGCKAGFSIKNNKLPVFIPSIELISLLLNLGRVVNDCKQSFDSTLVDIVENISGENIQENRLSEVSRRIIAKIENVVGGKFFVDKNLAMMFTNQGHDEKSNVKSASIMADGFRALGVLSRLFETGTIVPGKSGPILWDDPAKNLNPKLMRSIAEIVIDLAHNKQQVILTTHSFVMMHWFKILIDQDSDIRVRYHNLSRNEESAKIEILSTDDYSEITSNAIVDAYQDQTLYEIERGMMKFK